MKIAILGTRGIPNNHGGFEQFAENFSLHLSKNDHNVYVFNSHNHPYQKEEWRGVSIIHKFDPEKTIGTVGQFIYDLNCILECRARNFDIILQLGYTSSSIWSFLFPKKAVVITNMDGLEWRRSKYGVLTQNFLKIAEKWAVDYSDYLIADSKGIQEHIKEKYNKKSEFIAYGATEFKDPDVKILDRYNVTTGKYCMLLARLEPENNIELIVDGYVDSNIEYPLLIFGGLNEFGNRLKDKYISDKRIHFLGPNYKQDDLNNLRYFSRYYFHGHSVGGTNPSLLEAMASRTLIIAHDNIFNKSILRDNALYFRKKKDLTIILNKDLYYDIKSKIVEKNIETINQYFTWSLINSKYEAYLETCLTTSRNE